MPRHVVNVFFETIKLLLLLAVARENEHQSERRKRMSRKIKPGNPKKEVGIERDIERTED